MGSETGMVLLLLLLLLLILTIQVCIDGLPTTFAGSQETT